MNLDKLTSVGAAASFQADSESFLQLAKTADSNSDPKVRRQADFFDGCHWLALGNIDEAAGRFRKVRVEIPQADTILKKMEADRLRFANLSALEAWDLYNREAETMQKDVDRGYLARIFSNQESLALAREKRFGPERKLVQELKRRIEAGEAETLAAGLKQIQKNGPEELKELSTFLLSKDAKIYVGDPRPALIDFASSLTPDTAQVEFLLQRTAELEHQSDMPSTCYAVNALVRGLSSHAPASTNGEMERLSSSGQFAATLAKLALSASAEGVASDVALMFASAGLGNLAKLSVLTKLEKLGFTGYRAMAVAGTAGIGAESTAFWAGNTAKDAAVHDPEKVSQAEQLAQRYGATLLTIGGLKVFGKLGEGMATSFGETPGLAGQALVQGMKHGSGLAGLTATNQLNQALGLHDKPQGGFAESFAGDLFSYAEFAMAHKMADRATGQALSKIQEKQQSSIAVQERKLLLRPQVTSARPILLHPIFAPLWAFLGAGGMGGGRWAKPDGRRFLESIQPELDQIPHSEEWHHKIEQGDKIAAGSHRGIGYDEHNEDRYFFGEKSDGKTLLVAMDGLGGHLDGEQASAIVRRTFESGTLLGLSVPEILGLAHQTIEAYTLKTHPPSWRSTRRGRYDPGSVAAAVEIEPGPDGGFQGRFWNVGDAEAVVLRLSPEDGSVQVVHHTARPTVDSFERKRNGESFATTADGRLDLADIFDHRLIDSPVESFLGDKNPVIHYQRKALKAGDIVLVGSDGFFENFSSFDLIGKIIAESGAKTSAQVHEALFQESLIRMALLEIANNQELTHEVYLEAYRRALGKEPPLGWKGMYEPTIGPNGERKSHIVYYRGILDMDTGQVVDTLKQDNLTLLVQVLGETPEVKSPSKRNSLLHPLLAPLGAFMGAGGIGGGGGLEKPTESQMARRREILEKLKKDPDNMDLRQIYGDLLLEQGDPRGELIALQFARKKKKPSVREQELQEKWIEEHFPRMNVRGIVWSNSVFEKGFLTEVEIQDDSAKSIGLLFKSDEGPFISRVSLHGFGNMEEILACSETKNIRELSWQSKWLNDEDVEYFVKAPHFVNLTRLSFYREPNSDEPRNITEMGACILANSPEVSRLTHLSLRGCNIGKNGAKALERSPYLSQLISLDLSGTRLDEATVQALAESRNLKNLSHLKIYGRTITLPGSSRPDNRK